MAGVTLPKYKHTRGGIILREQENRNRNMREHVFPHVFTELVPGTLWGKPIAGLLDSARSPLPP